MTPETTYKPIDPSRQILTDAQRDVPELKWVDGFSQLLDTKFRIPGTEQRFGLDFILGLVPGAGDIVSLGMSGILVATMAKHGASSKLVARMLVNVALDATVGSIPILGNIFDLVYKANYRNAVLMREYYDEGRHEGSVWPVVIGVIITIIAIFILMIWLTVSLFGWLFDQF
ncbi:DUF4112 domain-containing protein [Lewinella sp. 4G2]|uniref:DUF4112 domain-containing protein n=1 Tax=Lewinella sp. 4G2 TaxID=1803372 RepID=UPI0007B48185|nr:DUF4112 domain-containing protein [Lewinella sp. 4G2]OAV45449.1 hypothetical protein A3850_013535 [Lewinella sp. 4G2]